MNIDLAFRPLLEGFVITTPSKLDHIPHSQPRGAFLSQEHTMKTWNQRSIYPGRVFVHDRLGECEVTALEYVLMEKHVVKSDFIGTIGNGRRVFSGVRVRSAKPRLCGAGYTNEFVLAKMTGPMENWDYARV